MYVLFCILTLLIGSEPFEFYDPVVNGHKYFILRKQMQYGTELVFYGRGRGRHEKSGFTTTH